MKRKFEKSTEPPDAQEKFVTRWSRLKQTSTNGEGQSQHSLQAEQPTAAKALTDADMPEIESLTPDSDYSGFLSPQVSESLRRLALRKLFQGAQFNVRDGLDDYDQDFTVFTKLGDVITADMKHLLEQELQRAEAAEATEGTDRGDDADELGEGKKQAAEQLTEPVSGARGNPEERVDEPSSA